MNKNSDNKNFFLATTALEDFWDTSKPMVFLGDWCLRQSRKPFWDKLDYKVIKSPLEDRQEFYRAYDYLTALYERILPQLSEKLNSIHGTDYSLNYWRITAGPWLMHYIHVLYDRYVSIKEAIEEYPGFATIGLAQEDFVIPADTYEFTTSSCEDAYNLQIYTDILSFLKKDCAVKGLKGNSCRQSGKKGTEKFIFKNIAKTVMHSRPVIVKHPYFTSRLIELKMFIKSAGRIGFDYSEVFDLPELLTDKKLRSGITKLEISDNEFEQLIAGRLAFYIPKSLLEGYSLINNKVKNRLPLKPKAILNSDSWVYDEGFKFWAADCAQRGTKIFVIQHGSIYGVASIWPLEEHELNISSKFYSWGWRWGRCANKVLPLPATKYIGNTDLGASSHEGILLTTNCFPRYLYRFQNFRNYDNKEYFDWQRRFSAALSPQKRNKLRVRLYLNDYGCDCQKRWDGYGLAVILENWDIPFRESLKNCRIHVSDHLASTYLDGLVMNKPTIMYWDPKVFEVRFEAKPYFDELRSSGILFDTPEEAARAVEKAYNNVEGWWNDSSRQAARKRFCDLFGRVCPDAISQWANEFNSIYRESRSGIQ